MGLADRTSTLRQAICDAASPGRDLFVAIVCNSCGIRLVRPTVDQLALAAADWHVAPELGGIDLCPDCKL